MATNRENIIADSKFMLSTTPRKCDYSNILDNFRLVKSIILGYELYRGIFEFKNSS
jgi:hypothetical protein